ncbi:MAG: hypothetical protein ABW216_00335 [Candidatus Rokuibacteriota bacterium]|jgi:hypothetical protein
MLALAAANAIGVVLFGTLYAIAGGRVLSQVAFVTCLVTLFVFATAVWVRTEARHRSLGPGRRVARIVVGLLVVVIATPAAVLAPLFWLDEQIPTAVGLRAARGGVMALVLIALVLVALVNVTGVFVLVGRAVLARREASRRRS